MKRVRSWLLGVLVAAPILFLVALFAFFMLAGIYFIWMFDQSGEPACRRHGQPPATREFNMGVLQT